MWQLWKSDSLLRFIVIAAYCCLFSDLVCIPYHVWHLCLCFVSLVVNRYLAEYFYPRNQQVSHSLPRDSVCMLRPTSTHGQAIDNSALAFTSCLHRTSKSALVETLGLFRAFQSTSKALGICSVLH